MSRINEYKKLFIEQLDKEMLAIQQREPGKLYHPVIYTLNMGGKRLRPILVLMSFGLYSDNYEKVFPAAVAIELFHNFTLLHDDIMDNASMRRNNETVHVRYSNNTAILSGDAMSILSYEYITNVQTERYHDVMRLFTKTALQICEGQQYDMDFETRTDVLVGDYLTMIGLKTAVLLAASLEIGALIANAPKEHCSALYEFGYNLGMAFQLQDDLLDSFGDQFSFGKNIGGDIVSNKKTFLMLKAIELASPLDVNELKYWNTSVSFVREEKVAAVKSIFERLGVVKHTRDKMEEYYQKAISNLDKLEMKPTKKAEFYQIASTLMHREN
jgi:geranylgeranyl diphosphate synthase, type II